MIDRLVEDLELYLREKGDKESLENELIDVLKNLEMMAEKDEAEENAHFLPLRGTIDELRFLKNNIFSSERYEPDIYKSLDILKSFIIFFGTSEDSGVDKTEESLDIQDELDNCYEELLSEIPENRFMTSNYLDILNALDKFEDGSNLQSLVDLIDEKLDITRVSMEKYRDLIITDREVTREFIMGNEFLMSGLDLWEEALMEIKESCTGGEYTRLKDAMEKLDEANTTLVIVQYHAEKVKNMS